MNQVADIGDLDVRMVVLPTADLDASITFYVETLGMKLKFRDGDHYAAIDAGSITIALATEIDQPLPAEVVVGMKTADVDAVVTMIEASGGSTIRSAFDGAHERRAIVRDCSGNGLVIYGPLPQ